MKFDYFILAFGVLCSILWFWGAIWETRNMTPKLDSENVQSSDSDPRPKEETLRTEYQAAQASAEYHDGLIWSMTNTLWAASLVLYGFILIQLGNDNIKPLLTCLCVLGFFMIVYTWVCARQFAAIKNQKYERCKEIEKELGMTQHTNLKYPPYLQRRLYAIMVIVFIVAWVVLGVSVWV